MTWNRNSQVHNCLSPIKVKLLCSGKKNGFAIAMKNCSHSQANSQSEFIGTFIGSKYICEAIMEIESDMDLNWNSFGVRNRGSTLIWFLCSCSLLHVKTHGQNWYCNLPDASRLTVNVC